MGNALGTAAVVGDFTHDGAENSQLSKADELQKSLTQSVISFLFLRNQCFLPGERGKALATVDARVHEVVNSIYSQIAAALSDKSLVGQVEKLANAAFVDAVSAFPMPDLPLFRYYHELIEEALAGKPHTSLAVSVPSENNRPQLRLV